MAPLHRTAVLLWSLLLLAGLVIAQSEPEHTITSFPNLPARLFFFEDTSSALYHDAMKGNVWLTDDEGHTWRQLDAIPDGKAAVVIEHPFDSNYVRMLSVLDIQAHTRTL
jgi:hypothetical protein